MTKLTVPQLGEGIAEVRILRLLKQPGDRVARDEAIYELEHDKATLEIESPSDGVLAEWLVAEEDTIEIGTAVAVIETARARVRIPPRTHKYARELGMSDEELAAIPAAGAVLMPEDVQAFADARGDAHAGEAEESSAAAPVELTLSARQQRLNRAMRRSLAQVVPASVTLSFDSDLLDRAVFAEGLDTATPFPVFARLVARTAAEHPRLRLRRNEDERLYVQDHVNLGIGVSTEAGDLTVAVVSEAETLSARDFAERMADAVERARAGHTQAGGSVPLILSYLGDDSATSAIPVVVPPAIATLFLGARHKGERQMTLSFDHSVINGEDAASFLTAIRDALTPAATAVPQHGNGSTLSQLLGIAEAVLGHAVAPDRPLGEQGMDSAAATRLVREIHAAGDTTVSVAALWRHPRLRDLAANLDLSEAPVVSAKRAEGPAGPDDPIAVIGMSCAVPGADSLDAFWSLLARGDCQIAEIPPSRAADLGTAVRAAVLDRIDLFDAEFFGITPRQAAAMDPQQRMLLELSWHAIQHAGIEPATLAGSDAGVFVGTCSYDYRERLLGQDAPDGYATIGTFPAFLANRISHFYDITGPSITLDTACSGALTALASAVSALRGGECGMALVGAANLLSNTFNSTAFQRAGMLSPKGHSRVFDTDADGFVRGEGAGWVVLKPLRQAMRDGDPVLAVLRGIAVNHGGRAASLTSPNPAAQTQLIQRALARAGLDPSALGYIEAHGTGTALGDPIEIDGIRGALAASNGGVPDRAAGPDGALWVGSVKSNIGHLEGASGLAGLIKVILALRHRTIPPSVGFDRLNPNIALDGTPLAVADRAIPWTKTGAPRIAAVSAFGFGGSNAHVIVQEAPENDSGRDPLPPHRFHRQSYWVTPGVRRLVGPDHALSDHVVSGHALLPGAALFDLLADSAPVALREVRFTRPVPVDGIVELSRSEDGTTRSGMAQGEPCATARVCHFESVRGDVTPGDGAEIDLYELLASRGIEVGSVYRLVTDLRRDGVTAWGKLSVPARCDAYTRRIAWLDAVLQASHAVLDGSAPLVAASIDELSWTGTCTDAAIEIRLVQGGQDRAVVDIDVGGTVRVRGLHLVRTAGAAEPAGSETTTDLRLYVPKWIPEPAPTGEATAGNLLYLHDDATADMAKGARIDITDPGLSATVSEAAAQGTLDLRLLVGGADWADDASGIAKLRAWLTALITTAQALGRTGAAARVRLVTTGLAAPEGGVARPGAALQGALLGALRTLPMELPAVTVCAVDLAEIGADASAAGTEPCGSGAPLIALHDRRWRQALVAEPLRAGAGAFRDQGRYVILGGAGGIGSRIARHLAARYRAELLLVGRSNSDAYIDALIAEVERAGGRAVYRSANLTQAADLAEVFAFCRSTFGAPDGVVHAVGSVSAALIGELSPSDVDALLATKVTAAIEIRKLVGDGLLVLSSSVAGLFGSHGGLNYAAANSFLDHYAPAADGRPGRVRTLDWGLWRDTGLAQRYAGHVLRSYPGLTDFTPADGLAALEHAVAGDNAQVAVLAGTPSALTPHLAASAARRLDEYTRAALHHRMRDLGLTDASARDDDGAAQLGVVPAHRRLLAAVLELLRSDRGDPAPLAEQRRALLADHPDLAGHLTLLESVLDAFGPILRGEVPATDVLFPGGDLSLVLGIYERNSLFDPINATAAAAVANEARRIAEATGRRPRILEIGAGVGSTTRYVLDALTVEVDYVYTDLSPAFLQHGQRRFGDAVSPRLLDIEKAPETQGFPPGTFDIVVAGNVVHATRDLETTLGHIGTALAPSGQLVLAEMVAPAAIYTLCFGVTEGWWRHTDPDRRLPRAPLLDIPRWQHLLSSLGWDLEVQGDSEEPGAIAVLIATTAAEAAHHHGHADVGSIADGLRDLVRELIASPNALVPGDASWQELGIDSLLNNELVAEVTRRYAEIAPTALFEHRTLDALAQHLAPRVAATGQAAPDEQPGGLPERDQAAAAHDAPTKPLTAASRQYTPPPQPAAANAGEIATTSPPDQAQPIAVVGLAGRYPGAADVDAFWRLLRDSGNPVREVPADRWDWRVARAMGGGYARWGCFLDDWNGFDPGLFKIPPRDAAVMDPQERQFLEVAWEAFETAGYARSGLASRRVGVFAGVTSTSYMLAGRDARATGRDNLEYAISALASVANRVSHAFDLSGPSLTLDTMCSSSLTAVHLACQALGRGEIEMALAGGANLYLHPDRFAGLCALGMPSRGARTRAFGAGADGFVPGEGIGAIVLKRLADAEADGDSIHAVIRGTGVNHGGGTGGYTVPNPTAQSELIADTLRRAGVAPSTVGYAEAHGTGTELGDPIEFRGLIAALGEDNPVRVGSVKSNIGHGEASAGIAGLTKAVLQLVHREFVTSLNAEPINPRLGIDDTAFRIQHRGAEWTAGTAPRRAVVSSFGAGGANAHVVLEEYQQAEEPASVDPVCIPLSAPDPQRLAETARRLSAALTGNGIAKVPKNLSDLAYTLRVGREHWPHRATLTCRDREDLADALDALARGEPHPCLAYDGDAAGAPHSGRRVALPTTPFARPGLPEPRQGSGLALVEEVRAPQARHATLTLSTSSRLLADHIVDGAPMLPGAVHPELVYETLLSAGRSPYEVSLDGLAWPEPAQGDPLRLEVDLDEDGTAFRVTVSGARAAEGAVVPRAGEAPRPYDIADLERRAGGGIESEHFYEVFAEAGFDYGRAFRTIRRLRVDGDDVVAHYALPEGEDVDGRHVLHPAVLDAACQAAAHRILSGERAGRCRPLGIDRLTMHRPTTRSGYIVVRRTDERVFDLTLVGDDGRVSCEATGFAVHVGDPAAPETPVHAYRLDWYPVASPTDAEVPAEPVAVRGKGPLARAAGGGSLAEAKTVLVDFTGLDDRFGTDPGATYPDLPLAPVFDTLRALVRAKETAGARVHVVTASDGTPSPLAHAIHGLVRSIAGETARFAVRLVTVDRDWLDAPDRIVASIAGDTDFDAGSWVWLGRERRKRATLVRQAAPGESVTLDADGCYLLIGGLGGAGQQIAASLLRRAPRARLVLVGRSEADQARLDALRHRAPAANIQYRRCDATDASQVEALAHDLPEVRGIVYLAGVLRDGFLRNKPDDGIRAVCNAKILGAATVDAAFARHALDFFVTASSLAALAGNQGQSDYAFANGFLDGFAASRAQWVAQGLRTGRTLSVGWPILAGSGMQPPEEALHYLAETLGLIPLPMERAADLLWRWLAAEQPRAYVALVHGDRAVWESALRVAGEAPEHHSPAPEDRHGGAEPSALGGGILDWLRGKVSDAVGIPADDLDADRDFAAYGIDSVALMRLNRAIEDDIGRLPMTTLLDSATLGELAGRLEAEHADQLGGILARAEPGGQFEVANDTGPADTSVLTERLQGIWLADQAAAPAAPYTVAMAWELATDVAPVAVSQAIDALVQRHPILNRVITPQDGELVFQPATEPPKLAIRQVAEPVAPLLREEAARRFRLADEPPLRAILWQPEGGTPVLQVVTHHLVVDGRSAELIRDDLAALCRGESLPDVERFTAALAEEHATPAERHTECDAFWSDHLADAPAAPVFDDHSTDTAGAHSEYALPRTLSDTLGALAARAGVQPFVALLAGFSLALARTTGRRAFLVSVPTYGRSHEAFDGTVGCFMNSVPLRIELEPSQPLAGWLAALREQVRRALAHADLPYPRILRHSPAEPTVTLAFQNWTRARRSTDPLGALVHQRGQQGHFDLGLEVTDTERGIEVLANHRTAVLDGARVDRIVDELRRMTVEMARAPDRAVADLLDPATGTLVARFRDVVSDRPDAIAVEDDTRRLTYRELDALAGRVAAAVGASVDPGEPVAVLINRDVQAPAVLLGVLAAGNPYVPLDAMYPAERLELVLERAGCRIALVSNDLAGLLPEGVHRLSVSDLAAAPAPARPAAAEPRPTDLAYLMFTSGSTGRPKGVAVSHGNVVHTLDAIAETIGWTAGDRLLAVTTICFDISVLELFLPLITGGTVVVADRTTVTDAAKLAQMLDRQDIAVMQATPAGWQLLLDGGWAGKPDLTALCGGEAMPGNLATALASLTRRLWNVYGPTEATIWSTIAAIEPDGPVHLGEPIGATDLVVTDDGELWIGGPAVGAGYWREPESTAQRFREHPTHPEAGGRYFRTGDLVRRDETGRLLFVGRADSQVKVRGYRVELGEIESVLERHPDIARAIVLVHGEGATAQLVAAVVPRQGAARTELDALRDFAGRRLPPWMLPERLTVAEALPQTPNGKIDRKAVAAGLREMPYTEIRTGSVPDKVAAAWAEVLGLEEPPPHDRRFFDVGGNSLLLGRLYALLTPRFPAARLEVADFFARPTVADQADLILERQGADAPARRAAARPRSHRELRRAFRTGDTS